MNLLLSLTEQCNLRCSYCYYKVSQADRSLVMSDDILEKAILVALERTIKLKHDFFNITFFGGEPTLRMDSIRKGVRYAKRMVKERRDELPSGFKLAFSVNTNGTLLDKEKIAFFKREKFRIYLSLDGSAARHNISRKKEDGSGSFADIAPHIPELIKMDTIVLSVITRRNIRGLAKSIRWIMEQGFEKVATGVDFDGKWTGEEMDKLALEYQKLALFWLEQKRKDSPFYLGTIQDKITLNVLGLRQRYSTCMIFKGGLGVATNGNIFPCSRFITSKEDAKYVLGNVLDPKSRIFKNPVAKDVSCFLKSDKPECEGCGIRYRCDAHECGCTAFYTTGSIHGVSAEVCTHERILAAICDDAVAKFQAEGGLF